MSDEIRAQLIVEAMAKGFPKLTRELKLVGLAVRDVGTGAKGFISLTAASKKLETQTASLTRQKQRMAEVGKQQEAQLAREAQKTATLSKAYLTMGAAMTGAAAVSTKLLAGTVSLAARVETLGIVTETLGKNVGMTTTEMRDLEKAVQAKGITLQATRGSIALMLQANIDLS